MESAQQSNWPTPGVEPSAQRCATRAAEGDRRLYAAIITDAINCVANPSHLKTLYPSNSKRRIEQLREKDRAWLMSNRVRCPLRFYRFVSFVECCDVLGLDPDAVREAFVRRGWIDGTGTFSPLAAHMLLDAEDEKTALHG